MCCLQNEPVTLCYSENAGKIVIFVKHELLKPSSLFLVLLNIFD